MDKIAPMVALLRVGEGQAAGPKPSIPPLKLSFTPAQAALLYHCVEMMRRWVAKQKVGDSVEDLEQMVGGLEYIRELSTQAGKHAEQHGIRMWF